MQKEKNIRSVASDVSSQRKTVSSGPGIVIEGVDDMLVKISRCCHPVPGDPIIGFITSGRGISVHKKTCVNLLSTDPHRWIDVEWSASTQAGHRVEIRVSAENSNGIFSAISASISSDDASIVEISAHITPTDTADFHVALEVENLEHLEKILQNLRQMKQVIWARRA
jgi:GTP pyrophosphokinase